MGCCMGHLGHTLNKYGTLVKTFCIEMFFSFSTKGEHSSSLHKLLKRIYKDMPA